MNILIFAIATCWAHTDALSHAIIESITHHKAVDSLSIDSRPRNKLKGKHKYLFINDEATTNKELRLFNELALVLCDTGVVPRKELFETFAAAVFIHSKFPHKRRVADIAAGHGLLSWFLLSLDDTDRDDAITDPPNSKPRTAVCIDRRMPTSAEAISSAMLKKFPELESRWSYIEADLSSVETHPSCLLCSVHACGTLTDYLIELAIGDLGNIANENHRDERVPIAVVPCCHTANARKGYRPHFVSGMKVGDVISLVQERKAITENEFKAGALADVIDEIRIDTLEKAGYIVEEVMLPEIFTARNRLLLGEMDAEFSLRVTPDMIIGTEVDMFKRRDPTNNTNIKHNIQIPLCDDEKSISICHTVSGKDRANTRMISQIPKHFSPALVISIWLDKQALCSDDESCVDALLITLQEFASQSCKEFEGGGDGIECVVNVLGEVHEQNETRRKSQRFRFTYMKARATSRTNVRVEKETAKIIDHQIRQKILDEYGSVLR